MTHSKVPAENLTSPAGARTSKRKGPHSDTQTEFALLTSTEEQRSYSPDPSVSLEEKERTAGREPATSPQPAGPPLPTTAL